MFCASRPSVLHLRTRVPVPSCGLVRLRREPPRGKIVGIVGEWRVRCEPGQEQAFRFDVVFVRPMEVGVLTRHDRSEQPAVEEEAVHTFKAKRVARHLEDHRRGAGIGKSAERAMKLNGCRCCQAFARIDKRSVARAERAEHCGPLARRIEQLPEDVARAGFAKCSCKADERQIQFVGGVETRRQQC